MIDELCNVLEQQLTSSQHLYTHEKRFSKQLELKAIGCRLSKPYHNDEKKKNLWIKKIMYIKANAILIDF